MPRTSRTDRTTLKGSVRHRYSTVLFKHLSFCGDEYCVSSQGLHCSPEEEIAHLEWMLIGLLGKVMYLKRITCI